MSACSLFISYAIRFNVILAAKLRFLFQIRVIIAKNIKFLCNSYKIMMPMPERYGCIDIDERRVSMSGQDNSQELLA